jgi:hypothetical protein
MFHCTSACLPPEATTKRESTRPVEFRQPGFDDAFDATTLFYDLILSGHRHGNDLIFVAPPFLNLFPYFLGGLIGRRHLESILSNYYVRDRCTDVWIANWESDSVELDFDFGSYRLTPQGAAHHLYKDKRVLYSLSKDNEVAWIVDWVQFHARNHGANAALIYDNASSRYTGEELERLLKEALPGLEINVVHWPYNYGPQGFKGNWWDSDFCQAAAFQDARFRFLDLAASVLNCDIDELVISENGESVFEITERSKSGCTMFNGRWISNAMVDTHTDFDSLCDLRHACFRYLTRTEGAACPKKWCVVPRRCRLEEQWGTHTVSGKDLVWSYSDSLSYRHFKGISTNWKYQRFRPTTFNPKLHEFDETLDDAFVRAEIAPVQIRRSPALSKFVSPVSLCKKIRYLATKWMRRLWMLAHQTKSFLQGSL